ncbi:MULTISPECIES: DUF2690 domain-containing protein [Kitasatospora]|uniref:DUF2690 domain-containing protein n=1 Tax=Kitasatospora cathayae TaxID=3004092 RepID=A0ABY7Q082_9ACTN|nr:DUF2690 domain-containing protein [Kitasatospora sp. HUAS 3-15]WBP86093.1 DUF2690 domain-containing protein [Kitasatospora sp. HUAS 3-15]
MRSIARKTITAGATLVLAMSGAVLAAGPASAATNCYASGCNGLDPAATTCADDAVTVSTSGSLELRYSPSCRAAWGRDRYSVPGELLTVTNSAGQSYGVSSPSGGPLWTRMVNDADLTSQAKDTTANGWERTGSY